MSSQFPVLTTFKATTKRSLCKAWE